jgi:hypothetical protein
MNPITINREKLAVRLTMGKKGYRREGRVLKTPHGKSVFIDRGGSVLGIAHLDTVVKERDVNYLKIKNKELVMSGALDDRLGAYVLLDLLPELGVVCDVLLTDGEESGHSTAEFFTPPKGKDYHWLFQFDRRGTDVVMYSYETDEMKKLLADEGFEVGVGSFSDIGKMEDLGVKAFNFGVGYHSEHSDFCYAELLDTLAQAQKFARFYHKHHATKLVHEKKTYATSNYHDYSSGGYGDYRAGFGNAYTGYDWQSRYYNRNKSDAKTEPSTRSRGWYDNEWEWHDWDEPTPQELAVQNHDDEIVHIYDDAKGCCWCGDPNCQLWTQLQPNPLQGKNNHGSPPDNIDFIVAELEAEEQAAKSRANGDGQAHAQD